MRELQFQKWVKNALIPAAFEKHKHFDLVDIIMPADKRSSGIPDMIVMTTAGVIAIEVKYRDVGLGYKPGNKAFKHPISELQRDILIKWGNIFGGLSFVLYGVTSNCVNHYLYLIPHHNLPLFNLKEITWNELSIRSPFVLDTNFKSKSSELEDSQPEDLLNLANKLVISTFRSI